MPAMNQAAPAPLVTATLDFAVQAIARFGKSRIAAKADISESVIRLAGRDGWNPTTETLRKLEIAAAELEAEVPAQDGEAA
jgi:hypothetical protein